MLFLSAGSIHQAYRAREVDRVCAVLRFMPWTGWICMAAFFAISAVPPFGIFFSELKIFEGILLSDRPWVLAVMMFLLLFIFINMSRTIFSMLYGTVPDNISTDEADRERFGIVHFASISLLLILIAIAVVNPHVLRDSIMSISKDFGVTL